MKKHKQIKLIGMLFLFLAIIVTIGAVSAATETYVSNNGGNDTNIGNSTEPVKP